MIDELATPLKYVIWGISPDFLRGTFDTSISKIDLSLKVSDKLFLGINSPLRLLDLFQNSMIFGGFLRQIMDFWRE